METFVKIGFTKIFLAAQKIWVAQNLGGGGGGGRHPPAPPARTLMGANTCFFNQTHYSFTSKFDITETGL